MGAVVPIFIFCGSLVNAVQVVQRVFYIGNSTGMSFFDLWNMKNVWCGSIDNKIYRHHYVEILNRTCVKDVSLIFDSFDESYSYSDPLTSNIEDLLTREPDSVYPSRADKNTEQRLIKHGKYEFLVLNKDGDKIYAGIYDDPKSPYRVQFFYNNVGSPYTENQDPTSFPDIKMATSFEVQFQLDISDSCPGPDILTQIGTCPKKPTFAVATYNVVQDIGTTTLLSCEYTTNSPITDLTWYFENGYGITKIISSISSPVKYNGGTLTLPELTIFSLSSSDYGKYYCRVENIAGISTGNIWHLDVNEDDTTEATSQSTTSEATASIKQANCKESILTTTPVTDERILTTNQSTSEPLMVTVNKKTIVMLNHTHSISLYCNVDVDSKITFLTTFKGLNFQFPDGKAGLADTSRPVFYDNKKIDAGLYVCRIRDKGMVTISPFSSLK